MQRRPLSGGPNCWNQNGALGSLSSIGYNLVGNLSGCHFTSATGDITGVVDPKLGPLADNGGQTHTHALLESSPAIDAGSIALTTDQRGVTRPQGAFADIGAFEFVPDSNDTDGDGWIDEEDNAPDDYNPDQSDLDNDGVGDVADPCPSDPGDGCDPNSSTSTSIGSDGGSIQLSDPSVAISIPANSLTEHTSISIISMGSDLELVYPLGKGFGIFGVDLGPPGTDFDPLYKPTIVFSWKDINNDGRVDGPGIKEDKLQIFEDRGGNNGYVFQQSRV